MGAEEDPKTWQGPHGEHTGPPRERAGSVQDVLVRMTDRQPLAPGTGPVVDRQVEAEFLAAAAEWEERETLAQAGVGPVSALLVTGDPGMGKRTVVAALARRLGLPLVPVDAAGLAGNRPGGSGTPLGEAIARGWASLCVLLLDGVDAIGRARAGGPQAADADWLTAVLVAELDRRPASALLAATTSRPELLDAEVARAFERRIHVGAPGRVERQRLLGQAVAHTPLAVNRRILAVCAQTTEGFAAGDLARMARRAVRDAMVAGEADASRCLARVCVAEVARRSPADKDAAEAFCGLANRDLGLSIRAVADLLGMPNSAVYRRLQRWDAKQSVAAATTGEAGG